MSAEDGAAPDVPYYLMPVAALFGTYAILGGLKSVFQVYKVATHNADTNPIPPAPLKSKQFVQLAVSVIASSLIYGFVCATVNNSISSADVFDPFEILAISSSAELSEIKSAYRQLSKIHHPDKGGDTSTFQRINLAYKALSDATAKTNWEQHGHPDGPQTQTLSFAMPDWLLHPEGNVAIALVLMYFAMFAGIIAYIFKYVKNIEEDTEKKQWDNSVSQSDMAYFATHLKPDSSHFDVLYCIATAPESIQITQESIDRGDEIKKDRIEYLNPEAKKDNKENLDFELDDDDDGWGDDDDDDEAAKAAKAKQEEKEMLARQVAAASGKSEIAKNIKLEGVDDGVLGQLWVEKVLETMGQWPPKFGDSCAVKNMTFAQKGGNAVSALEHKAVRRNLCMTLGRLNAIKLNSHPELIKAGQASLIDPTYFKTTMGYRQRTGLLLEAALRVAGAARSYRLYKTIVECVAMFKIGTTSVLDKENIQWFTDIMTKTYNGPEGVPRVNIGSIAIETDGEDEIATDDTCQLQIAMNRPHAENFTKQKVAMATKQNIPPQIALQTYREGWWILLRCQKLDGEVEADNEHIAKNPILAALDNGSKKRFESETEENRLLNAWPFIVSNIAQKTGKVKVSFRAPAIPGKYKFIIDIKSQEFLGCDQVLTVEKEIIDKALIQRKEEEEEEEDVSNEEEEELKKDK